MGNTIGRRKTAKVMKIDGETLKFKTPARAGDILKDYPDHVLMDSEAVRHLGVRAKALDTDQQLKPKRLYFLVQLPQVPDPKLPRRVRSSGINMSAKERLESLMLSRRSVSDLSFMKSAATVEGMESAGGAVRVKMRLPKAQVAKVMEESNDETEVAERIMELCATHNGNSAVVDDGQRKPALGSVQEIRKTREKLGVRFKPIEDSELV
ncbi:uncharacterized protein At1g66480-like isoform X2 [Magnolia sinica]|uniref:uncharacterized protein At1g66480-like isoform X2 n=1 Tax=Magnolia sinica TaxID=86752 RepID=UPI002657ECB7|nr:uncharacterized protein At1g66480-like isoform X2 [Magnolia sinica]